MSRSTKSRSSTASVRFHRSSAAAPASITTPGTAGSKRRHAPVKSQPQVDNVKAYKKQKANSNTTSKEVDETKMPSSSSIAAAAAAAGAAGEEEEEYANLPVAAVCDCCQTVVEEYYDCVRCHHSFCRSCTVDHACHWSTDNIIDECYRCHQLRNCKSCTCGSSACFGCRPQHKCDASTAKPLAINTKKKKPTKEKAPKTNATLALNCEEGVHANVSAWFTTSHEVKCPLCKKEGSTYQLCRSCNIIYCTRCKPIHGNYWSKDTQVNICCYCHNPQDCYRCRTCNKYSCHRDRAYHECKGDQVSTVYELGKADWETKAAWGLCSASNCESLAYIRCSKDVCRRLFCFVCATTPHIHGKVTDGTAKQEEEEDNSTSLSSSPSSSKKNSKSKKQSTEALKKPAAADDDDNDDDNHVVEEVTRGLLSYLSSEPSSSKA